MDVLRYRFPTKSSYFLLLSYGGQPNAHWHWCDNKACALGGYSFTNGTFTVGRRGQSIYKRTIRCRDFLDWCAKEKRLQECLTPRKDRKVLTLTMKVILPDQETTRPWCVRCLRKLCDYLDVGVKIPIILPTGEEDEDL